MKWGLNSTQSVEATLKEAGIDYPEACVLHTQEQGGDRVFLAFRLEVVVDPRDAYATVRNLIAAFESCTLIRRLKADCDHYERMVKGLRDVLKPIVEEP